MRQSEYLDSLYPAPPTENARRASELIADYREQVDAIRADGRRSADAKRDDIAELSRDVTSRVEQLREADRVAMDKRRVELERAAFGLGSTLVSSSDAISMRDASDRAATVRRDDEALELLERASMNGDRILEKAVAVEAYRRSLPETLDAYAARHPEFAPQLAELDDLQSVKADIGYEAWFYLPETARYPATTNVFSRLPV